MADTAPEKIDWEAEGFVPVGAQSMTNQPIDWGSQGFVPYEAPPPVQRKPVARPAFIAPDGTPVYDDPEMNRAVQGVPGRVAAKAAEGLTFGLSPHIAAAARWLTGTPYAEGLADARRYSKETEEQLPGVATAAETAGGLAPGMGVAKLVGSAPQGARLGAQLLRSGGSGALFGAANTAGHDIGQGTMRTFPVDVALGAGSGFGLGALGPLAQGSWNTGRAVWNTIKNATTDRGRDAVAGSVLREASGNVPYQPEASPLPGVTLRPAQATGNRGLASLERVIGSPPKTANGDLVQNGATSNQGRALTEALVGPINAENYGPRELVNISGDRGTKAVRALNDALKTKADELWNVPELSSVRLNGEGIADRVRNSVAQWQPSFRNQIYGPESAKLGAFMQDIQALGPEASIADINAIRSRVLRVAREAAEGAQPDSVRATAAGKLADDLLKAVEGDSAITGTTTEAFTPSMLKAGVTEPAQVAVTPARNDVAEAYQRARDFTRQHRTALDSPEINAILRENRSGNYSANDDTAFSRFFDTAGGTRAGLEKLQGLIDFARSSGQPKVADELVNAAQAHLRNLVARAGQSSSHLDAAGRPTWNFSHGAQAAETILPAVRGTSALANAVTPLEEAAATARMLARPSRAHGDFGSPTYDKLDKDRLIAAMIGQGGSSAIGAVGGGIAGWEATPDDAGWARTAAQVGGGALAGALLGRKMGDKLGNLPVINAGISKMGGHAATEDIKRRIATGLATDADYRRLIEAQAFPVPNFGDPGRISNSRLIEMLTRGVQPTATNRSSP